MPAITAVLNTHNDASRLGRCLETTHPCHQVLVLDHNSADETAHVARQYGARVLTAFSRSGAQPLFPPGWLLCLDPRDSLTEALAADLYAWTLQIPSAPAYSVRIREETPTGWIERPQPETRLVPSDWKRWRGNLPEFDPSSILLEGFLLRFTYP
jgi:hypothetical protein